MLSQVNRRMRLITPLPEGELVLSQFSGQESISQPFEFEIQALSENHEINLESLLGKPVTVVIDTVAGPSRYFNGLVIAAQQLGAEGTYANYTLQLRSWLWMLERYSDCRIFQTKNAKQIVEEVFASRGFADFKFQVSETLQVREYCVQYRETDLNFVSRLLEEEGFSYHFTHENGRHEMLIYDGRTKRQPFAGYAEIPFFAPADAAKARQDHISHWHSGLRLDTNAVELTDYDFEAPKANLAARKVKLLPSAAAVGEQYDYPGGYVKLPDGERYAALRGETLGAGYNRAVGRGDCEGICPGHAFTLTEHADARLSGQEYLVISARYQLEVDGHRSGDGGGEDFQCSFQVGKTAVPFRPPQRAARRRVDGIQTAVVVGPKGEEIHVDEFGRIKIQFHWDRLGKPDDTCSCWVRVATIWSGKQWGSVFTPRIGMEVVVDFLEGDPDKPVVIGCLYNGDNKPPYPLPAEKTKSGIKSRSSKQGGTADFNELYFEDKKGEELVSVHAQKDYQQHVENDRRVTVDHDEIVKIENDDSWTIGNDRKVDIGNKLDSTVGADETRDVGNNRTTTVGNNDKLHAKNNVEIKANNQITLVTGQSKIVMKMDGTIEISCMNLKIAAMANAEIKANAKLDAKGSMTTVEGVKTTIKGSAMLDMSAGGMAQLKGGIVMIN